MSTNRGAHTSCQTRSEVEASVTGWDGPTPYLRLIPSFLDFASTVNMVFDVLSRLRRERSEQLREESRAALDSVDEIRKFIIDSTPPPQLNVTLNMCVLKTLEFETSWHLLLIDKSLAPNFEEFSEVYENLDRARGNKYVFQLTIWKSRNSAYNQLGYRAGFCYKFVKVHTLKILFDSPQGCTTHNRGDQIEGQHRPTSESDHSVTPHSPSSEIGSHGSARQSSLLDGDPNYPTDGNSTAVSTTRSRQSSKRKAKVGAGMQVPAKRARSIVEEEKESTS